MTHRQPHSIRPVVNIYSITPPCTWKYLHNFFFVLSFVLLLLFRNYTETWQNLSQLTQSFLELHLHNLVDLPEELSFGVTLSVVNNDRQVHS